jgi:hypothetical protein
MVGTFLEKVGGWFDRRFLIAYWSPVFIGLVLVGGLVILALGPPVVFGWWAKLNGEEQIVLGVGSLLATTLLAYVLDALTTPLIRLYEGYWSWKQLARLAASWQEARKARLVDSAHSYHFPRNSELLKPTRLGNVLASAEDYSYQVYRLDAVIWWPRLVTLLPETFRAQLDTALTPMVTLLNLSMILTLTALGGGASLLLSDRRWWLGVSVFIGGLVLARACYIAASNQAVDYGQLVRVAFDFYRHDILKQMHVSVPDNLVEERLLWDALKGLVEDYIPPWDAEVAALVPRLARPFYYDTHPLSTTPTQSQEVTPQHEKPSPSPLTRE